MTHDRIGQSPHWAAELDRIVPTKATTLSADAAAQRHPWVSSARCATRSTTCTDVSEATDIADTIRAVSRDRLRSASPSQIELFCDWETPDYLFRRSAQMAHVPRRSLGWNVMPRPEEHEVRALHRPPAALRDH